MEKMAEAVSGSHYQRLHHMLSESTWNRSGVRQQLIADANNHFGYALTWFGLAIALIGFYVALLRRRLKRDPS